MEVHLATVNYNNHGQTPKKAYRRRGCCTYAMIITRVTATLYHFTMLHSFARFAVSRGCSAGRGRHFHASSSLSAFGNDISEPSGEDPAIEQLINNNREWVKSKGEEDPDFFPALGRGQQPDFLYIGCSDSRVSISALTGMDLGHMFVHRNIANMVGTF